MLNAKKIIEDIKFKKNIEIIEGPKNRINDCLYSVAIINDRIEECTSNHIISIIERNYEYYDSIEKISLYENMEYKQTTNELEIQLRIKYKQEPQEQESIAGILDRLIKIAKLFKNYTFGLLHPKERNEVKIIIRLKRLD